jgi:hypothetical protein
MHRRRIAWLVGDTLGVCGLLAVVAVIAAPSQDALPPPAAQAIAALRAAAAQPSPKPFAELTAWPFRFEGRLLQREAFVREAVPALFTPAVRACLQRAVPQAEDGRLVLWCKPYGFYLGPTPAGWRLIEFAVDVP